jgi:hypothetical protein
MIITDFNVGPLTAHKKEFELTPSQQILIMPVGDVHAYSQHWPEKRFQDHIKWGVDKGAYFLGMGEYLDFTSASQRAILSGLRGSQKSMIDDMVKKQVEKLFKLIEFSKDRWLGLLEGDHYHQYESGITVDQHLCQLLNCPFLGTSTLMNIRLALPKRRGTNVEITIFAHHGAGGGRKQGSHLHRIEDLITMVEADIYLMGHSHSKANAPLDRLYRTRDGYLYHKTKLIARTGGFLRGYSGIAPQDLKSAAAVSRGSYVEEAAYAPSALGGMVISLGVKLIEYKAAGITDKFRHGRRLWVPDIHYSV